MSQCDCPMRDGAHESICGKVGEYESVHCQDCDTPTWMCAVSFARCRSCLLLWERSEEYKIAEAAAMRRFLESVIGKRSHDAAETSQTSSDGQRESP